MTAVGGLGEDEVGGGLGVEPDVDTQPFKLAFEE